MKIAKLLVIAAVSLVSGVAVMNEPGVVHTSYAAVKRIHGYKIMKPKFHFKYSTVNEDAKFDPYKGVTYISSRLDKVYGTVKKGLRQIVLMKTSEHHRKVMLFLFKHESV